MTSGLMAKGRFGKQDFRYVADEDVYIVAEYRDCGLSGAKGRQQRPGMRALLTAVSRREIDVAMAWSVDRKRLAMLKETVPAMSKVLVLTYLVDPIAALQVEALEAAAPSLGLTLLFRDIKTPEDFQRVFESGVSEGANGLFLTSASMFNAQRARITELAARHRLPAIYPFSSQVIEADGLMAYHVDEPALHKSASIYVDKILKGARPSELPIQQPSKFRFVINLKTAKALGLGIPAAVMARADEVIE